MNIPDPPDIRRTEASGWPRAVSWPLCPVCGAECESFYRDRFGETVGCENCVTRDDAWDETFGT